MGGDAPVFRATAAPEHMSQGPQGGRVDAAAATVAGLSRDTRKPVDTCADYLLKYAPYLQYDRYLAAGYLIATGVVEGACRHLVRDRMELTGGVPG